MTRLLLHRSTSTYVVLIVVGLLAGLVAGMVLPANAQSGDSTDSSDTRTCDDYGDLTLRESFQLAIDEPNLDADGDYWACEVNIIDPIPMFENGETYPGNEWFGDDQNPQPPRNQPTGENFEEDGEGGVPGAIDSAPGIDGTPMPNRIEVGGGFCATSDSC